MGAFRLKGLELLELVTDHSNVEVLILVQRSHRIVDLLLHSGEKDFVAVGDDIGATDVDDRI